MCILKYVCVILKYVCAYTHTYVVSVSYSVHFSVKLQTFHCLVTFLSSLSINQKLFLFIV